MAYLKVLGGPIPPGGKTLSNTVATTLTADFSEAYSDSSHTYPKQHLAEYDVTNDRWKPFGGADGVFWHLPGPDGAEPAATQTKFTEVQSYDDGTFQVTVLSRRVIGDGSGNWDYASPDPDVLYFAIPPTPVPALYTFMQSSGGHNWNADSVTREGGTYFVVTIGDILRPNTEPMVFNSTLGILFPGIGYTRLGSVITFLDGFKPVSSETIFIWAIKDVGG